MNFIKYTSIENSYRSKYIEKMRFDGLSNVQYVAREKIHGANFSFITNGAEVLWASRNSIVDGTFYGCQEVVNKYSDKVLNLKNTYFEHYGQLTVFGELYGPGIQKGVDYGDDKGFLAFDILIDGEYLNQADLDRYLDAVGIPVAPFIGIYTSLDNALAEPPVFKSLVYAEADGSNEAEGLVIQPLYTNGYKLKHKNPSFSEKQRNRDPKPRVEDPYEIAVVEYINMNRVQSVLSKRHEPTLKDFGKIIGDVSLDVLEDMVKDGFNKKDIRKAVARVVSVYLKEHLLKELL